MHPPAQLCNRGAAAYVSSLLWQELAQRECLFTQRLPSTGPAGIRELVRDGENNAGPLPTQPRSLSTQPSPGVIRHPGFAAPPASWGRSSTLSAQHTGCPNSAAPGLLSSMGLNPPHIPSCVWGGPKAIPVLHWGAQHLPEHQTPSLQCWREGGSGDVLQESFGTLHRS